jgi:hypothetical protein
VFNPLNAELNPTCHLLALLGGATIVVVSRLRVKKLLTVGVHADITDTTALYSHYDYVCTKKHLIIKYHKF